MWVVLSVISAFALGAYDIFKKLSLKENNVLWVLFLNTLFCTLLMSPVLVGDISEGRFGPGTGLIDTGLIMLKSVIVLSSWVLGYFSIKHLPLTIAGPVNASRPVIVLVGALLIFGERLNALQWAGVILGFGSLYFISRIGGREGFSFKQSRWLWMAIGATFMGAVSALYDKFLLVLYEPLRVQAWYNMFQCVMMGVTVLALEGRKSPAERVAFRWSWSIPMISVMLTAADLAYFYALATPAAMVAVVSMLRRGSVIVSFVYGVVALREKHVGLKLVDLGVLLVGLTLLVLGSS